MAEIGIGETLRETRMRARIDIGEVELRTKIRAKYLRAIENEEWGLLPGPIYVKSFLRTYAEYLGLDSRLLLDEYKRRYELPAEHELRPLASIRRERERRARVPRPPVIPPWAVIGAVLAVALVGLYLLGKLNPSRTVPVHHRASALVHRHTAGRHRSGGASRSHTVRTPAAPASVTLAMVPTGPVWVCVEARNGERLINGVTYSAGQTVPVQRRRQLFVTLGNANVKLTVNGRPYPLKASASAIGLKLTPAGVFPLANRPTCG
jgi:hypothetical protein